MNLFPATVPIISETWSMSQWQSASVAPPLQQQPSPSPAVEMRPLCVWPPTATASNASAAATTASKTAASRPQRPPYRHVLAEPSDFCLRFVCSLITAYGIVSGTRMFSYVALIWLAIQQSPAKQCTLREICAFIRARFTYFAESARNWEVRAVHSSVSIDALCSSARTTPLEPATTSQAFRTTSVRKYAHRVRYGTISQSTSAS